MIFFLSFNTGTYSRVCILHVIFDQYFLPPNWRMPAHCTGWDILGRAPLAADINRAQSSLGGYFDEIGAL